MKSLNNTKTVIIKYFDYINTQQWEKWTALFDEHIVIDEAISGHMEGMKGVRDSADGIKNGFSSFRNDIVEIIVEGDKGMVVCDLKGITQINGDIIESRGANFFGIQDGKIVYMSSFHDKTPFNQAFAAASQVMKL